jgi:hypothetical protein
VLLVDGLAFVAVLVTWICLVVGFRPDFSR